MKITTKPPKENKGPDPAPTNPNPRDSPDLPTDPDLETIDPGDLVALQEALGARPIHNFNLKLPSGQVLKIRLKQGGIAELMEASRGEKLGTRQSQDFDPRAWRRQAIRKLNLALLDGYKFVDDLEGHRPDLAAKQLPFSAIRGDDFNLMMELAFPGYLAESENIRLGADAIRNESMSQFPLTRNSDRCSG